MAKAISEGGYAVELEEPENDEANKKASDENLFE